MDSYDHVWGIFITAAGKRRRLDVMIIPPDMWPYALLGWSGSKQYLRFLRQHAGNIGMNLNSHGLFRMVEVRVRPLALPAAAAAAAARAATEREGGSAAVGAGGGSNPGLMSSSISGASAAAAVAGSSGSSSLAEAVNYIRVSAAAGMSRVVLAVPDEASPLDRNLREWWPQSWKPSAAADGVSGGGASAAADGVSVGGAANAGGISGGSSRGGMGGSGVDGAQRGVSAQAAAAAVQRVALAAMVHAGCGSGRAVTSEADICELLGVPFRDPRERCC
jgi:hypothetical protein